MTHSRTRLTAYVGLILSAAAVSLVLSPPWHASALAGALLLASVPAGATIMCWIDSGNGLVQAALTLVVSVAVFALASTFMIWTSEWHPKALLALAGLGIVSCLIRLVPRAHR